MMETLLLQNIIKQTPAFSRPLDWVRNQLEKQINSNRQKIVVLDDDPTGSQRVHNIIIYTDYSRETLKAALLKPDKTFFILTNSRSLLPQETRRLHEEIMANLLWAKKETGQDFIIMSRSDSTLRGHYPLEIDVIRRAMEEAGCHVVGEILCPYFKEGGRFTINNIHYVQEGAELIPAGQTEFARDQTFGYLNSNLIDFVQEKSKNCAQRSEIQVISLESLRSCDLETIRRQLISSGNYKTIIVNAIDDGDLEVFSLALYPLLTNKQHFIFRTAASLVRVMAGISSRELLTYEEISHPDSDLGGLIIVGSHTEKTTRQINNLVALRAITPVPFYAEKFLTVGGKAEIERVAESCSELIAEGKTALVYTERQVLASASDTPATALERSRMISYALVHVVQKIKSSPVFILAKGGITSSDIAVKGLDIKEALVLGQIQPGVSVWQADHLSRFPSVPYIVFPGNVGTEATLKEVVKSFLPSSGIL